MIKKVDFKDIDETLKMKLNNFILVSFPESRLYTYDIIIYDINEESGEILGFTGLNIYDNTILVNQLCVEFKNRNQGIATSLLSFIENNFNISNICLYIGKFNYSNTEKLYNFYIKRGFNEVYNDFYKYKMCKQL